MPEQVSDARKEIAAVNDFTPTAENVNALPERLRAYIHDLETRCDPAGDVAARIVSTDNAEALSILLDEKDAEIERLNGAEEVIAEQADEIERLKELIGGRYQAGGRSEIDYQNEVARLTAENAALRKACGVFLSAARSGETVERGHYEGCDEALDAALAKSEVE